MSGKPAVRKRGKKPSKRRQEESEAAAAAGLDSKASVQKPEVASIPEAAITEDVQPDWITSGPSTSAAKANEAPFGFVDAEVKAYFRQVWSTLQELEEQGYRSSNTFAEIEAIAASISSSTRPDGNGDGSDDQLTLLIKAILSEMDGKELMLATDPDTSRIMESLVERIGQKPLRVLMDRMAGNYATLACHRFGSHVLQTCLSALQPAITAENSRQVGKGKARLIEIVNEEGVLRSSTHIFLGFCSEIEENIQDLSRDAFGSHVLRTALLVLTGQPAQGSAGQRSKRSAKYRKKKDGEAIEDPVTRASADTIVAIPSSFLGALRKLTAAGFDGVSADDVRGLAIDPVASPVLQLFMALEASNLTAKAGESGEWKGSLIDVVLDNLVSSGDTRERSDHLESCLRDSVASHALQVAVSVAPELAVERFYTLYVAGRLGQLGAHPAARHVVSESIRRLCSPALIEGVVEECRKVGDGLVKQSAIGVLQAVVEKCGAAQLFEKEAVRAVLVAFKLGNKEAHLDERDTKATIPVILCGKTKKAYLKVIASLKEGGDKRSKKGKKDLKRKRDGAGTKAEDDEDAEDAERADDAGDDAVEIQADGDVDVGETPANNQQKAAIDPTAPLREDMVTIPGSLLLQTLARLSSPHNEVVVSSLLAQPSMLPLACNATSMHIILACLNSGTLPFAQRRKIIMALLPDIHKLVDDKYGSRVADAVWDRCDGFTREKLTSTVVAHERDLLSSYYGGFFLRKLNLALFRKNKMREWKEFVTSRFPAPPFSPSLADESDGKRAAVVLLGDAAAAASGTAGGKAGTGIREVVYDDDDDQDIAKGNRKKKKTEKVDRELDDILAQF